MSEPDGDDFVAQRDHLTSVAYRMLGSLAEAEDAVQEAWLRWDAADRAAIEQPRAWLTTVTGRICLDVLRSARVRREAYVGPWLPEPIVHRLADPATPDPGEQAARADELGTALLVVLDRLTPEQRVAFVLHDVFAVPFGEIAEVLDATPEATRQLASRARRAVRDGAPRGRVDPAEQRRILDAFLRACRAGDLDGLLAVLAPDIVATGDGGGIGPAAREPVVGLEAVARFVLGLVRRADKIGGLLAEPVLVNGDLGLLLHQDDSIGGTDLTMVMSFDYASGHIAAIYNQLNPYKLTRLPEVDATRSVWTPGETG